MLTKQIQREQKIYSNDFFLKETINYINYKESFQGGDQLSTGKAK